MPEHDIEALMALARKHWPGGPPADLETELLPADGSPRLFIRFSFRGRSLVGMSHPNGPAENQAWLYLAERLRAVGVPAPCVLGMDQANGRFVMEDLGRASLQEAAALAGEDQEALIRLYEPVLALLARMQARVGKGMDTSICFDGPELTPGFLLEREAGYFLAEFVGGVCGLTGDGLPRGLEDELIEISRRAGEAGPRGFVHRDFQSRNLVVEGGRLGLVDFQGGRLGPAQYDLAALLHDPYVQLSFELRHRLKELYLDIREKQGPFDRTAFEAGWPWVSLSRVMQALGAYGFLTRKKNRPHFAQYAVPALATLGHLARRPELEGFPTFREMVGELPKNPEPVAFAYVGEES